VIGHPNTIVSNVPRGAADLEFLGIPVHTTVSVGDVIDGRGVGHVATSIGDALTLSVSCDTGMLPDIDHYMDLLAKEYAAFRALT
ncbi:WS/DGAT domain-containing protein, partial [Streptomyces albidoflavus]